MDMLHSVKYLAEDGKNAPVVGAAAICSPWDLLVCDRFMNHRLVQKLYNKALAVGLKDYAELHEDVLSRLSNWEGVKKFGTLMILRLVFSVIMRLWIHIIGVVAVLILLEV